MKTGTNILCFRLAGYIRMGVYWGPFCTTSHVLVIYLYLTDDFSQHLLKYMDADQLPKYLGGTLTDPDGNPRCLTMVSSKIYANNNVSLPSTYKLA